MQVALAQSQFTLNMEKNASNVNKIRWNRSIKNLTPILIKNEINTESTFDKKKSLRYITLAALQTAATRNSWKDNAPFGVLSSSSSYFLILSFLKRSSLNRRINADYNKINTQFEVFKQHIRISQIAIYSKLNIQTYHFTSKLHMFSCKIS